MKRKKRIGSDKDSQPIADNDQETTTESKGKFGRRGFLKIGAGAAAVTFANPLESIAQRRLSRSLMQANTSGPCGDVHFSEPTPVDEETIDNKSVLKYELNAEKLAWTYTCNGKTETSLQPVFNGALPGPTLVVKPGTLMQLKLNNNLDTLPKFGDDTCTGDHHHEGLPKPGCFQHTNLHFHGLQVSPCSLIKDPTTGKVKRHCGPYKIDGTNPPLESSSDDVLLDIFPGKSNEYRVAIPDMHAPGTNWYHSHMHGASAYQLSGGMAGAIIIQEPTEEARIVRKDLDKIFLLQEIIPNPPPPIAFPPVYGTQPVGGGNKPDKTTGRPNTLMFVNGLCRPTMNMKTGQMMRWRFINAGATPKALMKLRLVKLPTGTPCPTDFAVAEKWENQLMHLIAMDGISFYGINPQPVRYHLLGLGNRADFLVKIDTPGTYLLLKDGYPLESVFQPDSTNYTFASGKDRRQVLMYIDVEDSKGTYTDEIPKKVPGQRPAYLTPIANVDKVRTEPIKFMNMNQAQFQIDGKFYPHNNPVTVDLNTAEEWTIQNWADFKNNAKDVGAVPQSNTHPFHVHLNPFQIVDVPFDFEVAVADLPPGVTKKMEKSDPDNWPFWDTVPLPGKNNPKPTESSGEVKIWSRFLIYDGEYVSHCHILIHEDVGMMIDVKLVGEGIGPNEPVHDYPDAAKECIKRTSKPATN